ncbi:MAG: LPP20 family lipoprotein [Thermodesulfobacteriota bacterium]
MNIKQWFVIGWGVFLLGACAGSATAPTTAREPDFPAQRYLTAVGIAATEAEARRQAVVEMSHIFESRVFAETYASVQSVINETDQEVFSREAESRVRTVSEVELKGVRIGKTWQDSTSGQVHAMAVLDKFQARRSWEGEIEAIETAMEGTRSSLAAARSDFRKLQAQNQLMSFWLQRESIRSRLRVIGFAGIQEEEEEIHDIVRANAEIRGRLKILIDISGKKGPAVISTVGQRLTENGYNLVLTGQEPDIVLQGEIRTENVNLPNPQVRFVRAQVILQLIDRVEGRQVAEIKEDIRKGHVDRKEAARNAVEGVAGMTAARVIAVFGQVDASRD